MSTDTIDADSHQLHAAERLPTDLTLIKIESETIFAVAKAQPRDPMKIVAQLKQLIDAYPQAADEAIYSKPVGTVTEITCGDCGVKYEVSKVDKDTLCSNCDSNNRTNPRRVKKFAEGLSIRAAESIRSIYGYTRLATTSEMLADGSVKLTGILVDYAAGNVTSDERIVSRWYRSSAGPMQQIAEDRFLNITVKAEKAKLRRDVILDNTPGIVKALFRDACEVKLMDLVSPELIEQKIIPAFLEHGVTREHLDKLVGRPFKLGWREEDRLQLRKILSALKSGETTTRELLADLDESEQKGNNWNSHPTNGAGGAKVSDFLKPKQGAQEQRASASLTPPATTQPATSGVVPPDEPTEAAFQKFRADLMDAPPEKARDLFDSVFITGTIEFSQKQEQAAWELVKERQKEGQAQESKQPEPQPQQKFDAKGLPVSQAEAKTQTQTTTTRPEVLGSVPSDPSKDILASYMTRVDKSGLLAGLNNIRTQAKDDPNLNVQQARIVSDAVQLKLDKLFPARAAATA